MKYFYLQGLFSGKVNGELHNWSAQLFTTTDWSWERLRNAEARFRNSHRYGAGMSGSSESGKRKERIQKKDEKMKKEENRRNGYFIYCMESDSRQHETKAVFNSLTKKAVGFGSGSTVSPK